MPKPQWNLNEIRELHRTGELELAKKGYLTILKVNPRNVEALHSVGIICAQQKDLTNASTYLQKTIELQPSDPTIQLHLANVLKMQGLFHQASELLEKTVKAHPEYVPALNNLGTIYYALGKISDAIHWYRIAIHKQPNYADAYYNLGLALLKNNEPAEAITMLQTLLKHVPDHFAARFHLACAFMQNNDVDQAIKEFLTIEKSHPHHFETQSNLATCYLKKGIFDDAKKHYIKANELNPEDTQILFNLGIINTQLGNDDAAIQYYQRTINVYTDHFAAHNNLGVAFLAKPHLGLALQHFKEALRIQPHNTSISYTIKALEQNQHLLAAPPDYITTLFDAYADHYDSHLTEALDYQVPQLLLKALTPYIKQKTLDILDLGCGTGLCGISFKPYAKSLIGVDLSPNMLAMAKTKNIYDELLTQDLTQFLTQQTQQYDLMLAGDVLVYIGDLQTIFKSVYHALRPQGLFAFNAEITTTADFKMNQSGRFAHSKVYLDQLADAYHFKILSYQSVITRQQNNEPVYGHLYILSLAKHF